MGSRDRLRELQADDTPLMRSSQASTSQPASTLHLNDRRYATFTSHLSQLTTLTRKLDAIRAKEKNSVTNEARKQNQDDAGKIMTAVTKVIRCAKEELRTITKADGEYQAKNAADQHTASIQIRTNLRAKAQEELTQTMQTYQASLSLLQSDLRTRSIREVRIVDPSLQSEKIEELIDSGGAQQYIQAALQRDRVESTVLMIEERHLEIRKLEGELVALAELFRDLQTLVDVQQESINQIVVHIDNTQHHVEVAEERINEAAGYQRDLRKKQCLCLCILLIVLIVVLIPVLKVSGTF